MCGITGYAGFTKMVSLEKSIAAIKHRGPDADGAQYFKNIALGNTRLAILDLSEKGRQPMFNHDKSLCITFNGEIYNFLEIKKVLSRKYKFKSDSDTEVILYAYQEWGYKCLDKLSGMFSFVIYDLRKNLLFGARDRLGQKPLKYYHKNGKLVFASEIKAILGLLDHKVEIDEIALDNFLTLQYVPSPATGFKDIYKLPAGHYFTYKNGDLTIRKYWSIKFSEKIDLPDEEWQELIFTEIKKAINSHLISDVPVGALLSGGLDSSIIVALMALNSPQKINTFSIGFNNDMFDESPYAKIVAEMYSTNHHQLRVNSGDLVKNLNNITKIYDEPIADNSILPTLLVSKLASNKVKVALTGDGGDENFAGYDRYVLMKISRDLSKLPAQLKKMFGIAASSYFALNPNKQSERMNRFLSGLDDPLFSTHVKFNSFFSVPVKHNLYTNEFKNVVSKNNSYGIYKNHYDPKLDTLDNALKIDINTYLPDDLLYKTDSASMAYGLELRSPFLDHSLMELVAKIPSQKKIIFLTKKKLLRDIALNKKLLPSNIINRPKHGFTIPQNEWFKGNLKKYIYETILDSKMIGIMFDKSKIQNYLDDYYSTKLNYDNNIFALLVLALWVNEYF
jgi:asparagine synthase (glutamine-hydrolysing)